MNQDLEEAIDKILFDTDITILEKSRALYQLVVEERIAENQYHIDDLLGLDGTENPVLLQLIAVMVKEFNNRKKELQSQLSSIGGKTE